MHYKCLRILVMSTKLQRDLNSVATNTFINPRSLIRLCTVRYLFNQNYRLAHLSRVIMKLLQIPPRYACRNTWYQCLTSYRKYHCLPLQTPEWPCNAPRKIFISHLYHFDRIPSLKAQPLAPTSPRSFCTTPQESSCQSSQPVDR